MVFEPPSWVPKLPFGKWELPFRLRRTTTPSDNLPDPPDSIPIAEFMTTDKYARYPLAKSRNPFTCGLTGKTFGWNSVIERRDFLAQAIGKRLGWLPNEETEWDKVACIFSVNTVKITARCLVLPAIKIADIFDDRLITVGGGPSVRPFERGGRVLWISVSQAYIPI